MRNAALHLVTPSGSINWYLYRGVQVALGSQLNNPKTTWARRAFDVTYTQHEDTAGNLIQMLIVISCVILLPIKYNVYRPASVRWYTLGIVFGAILFCWMLRWQPWGSRLHTPLFALAAPLMVIAISSNTSRIGKGISSFIVFCLVIYSLPFALANQSRSLVSLEWNSKDRQELYFQNNRALFDDYNYAINIVKKARIQNVGLFLGSDDWEYPFWVLAQRKEREGDAIAFVHVGVNDIPSKVNAAVLPLPYVIATKKIDGWKCARNYSSVYTSNHVSVFRKLVHENAMAAPDRSSAASPSCS